MLALSPTLFPTFGWPIENSIIHDISINNNLSRDQTETSDYSPISRAQNGISEVNNFGLAGGDALVVKKLNHNASERTRRKRINSMYYSLFSLLPPSDQMQKKLSIAVTVSRVVKYIPELQKELEELFHKKEELSSRILSRPENSSPPQKKIKKYGHSSGSDNNESTYSLFVSTAQINATEIMIQISMIEAKKSLLYEDLQILEANGLLLLNASAFESVGDRVFYNLHFQVQWNFKMDFEKLREKILSIYENQEESSFNI